MTLTRRDLHRLAAAGAAIGLTGAGGGTKESFAQAAPPGSSDRPGQEPLGGQPPAGAQPSIVDFDYQIKYQRAFEAILWAMPATAIYRFRGAAFDDHGVKDNDIIALSAPATPRLEALTANSTTPYIAAFTDLRKGPAVLDLPAAGPDGSLYGQVVDAWQFTIADVGPAGLDKGKGGKILFTPPGYKGAIPKGYIHVASPSYRIAFAFRSVPAPGKSAKDAYSYTQRLRMYYLSEAGSPPKQKFIDLISERYATLPFYDERSLDDINAIVSVEPVRPEDKLMMGMLTSLGIERGKPFAPDATARRAARQAAIDVWAYLQSWYDNFPAAKLYWPDRHYASLLQPDRNNRFTFSYDDLIDIIPRAAEYFWCTFMPKELSESPATQYMMALADKNGERLEAGKLYKLDVPANVPVRQFWALTVYDRATFSFIYTESGRTTLSSFDIGKMTKNANGGVTLYVGPKSPEGLEANWIPTRGKRPLPAFRFYGPTDAFNNRTFKMPDFEPVG